ncbi:MAG: type 1 glutamine amidotransferase [Acidobacteria bacterium]|nr:type 1 glutamine amidotransferase [Acidobacteriota bacterium]
MANDLTGKRVAILATDGFEQSELTEPYKALQAAGATVEIVSPRSGEIKGWDMTDWGETVKVDVNLKSAQASTYDALVLPGGVMNPDRLRMDENAVSFVKEFFTAGKPVSAICHGPWTLIEAGVVKGRTMTSWPSLKTDLMNAGAIWVDREVVEDKGLVTSRKPDDLKAFNDRTIHQIAESGLRRSAA